MDTIWVYGDFDWLKEPICIGQLSHETLRGSSSFAFEFGRDWLERYGFITLSADLNHYAGKQYTKPEKDLFGCFSDSLPDRWGRTLIQRREQVLAQAENRTARKLNSFDCLLGLDDRCHMGAFRFKKEGEVSFVNDDAFCPIPPITNLRALNDASIAIERSEANNQLPNIECLRQLFRPGSSLGGARPKAVVCDEMGTMYMAKFPSIKDDYDVALWEHVMHKIAKHVGIEVADTNVINTGGPYHILLSKRFDRTYTGKRIHFSSAMTELGLTDGQNADTGHGYLDIVDFILESGCQADQNQHELFKRVAFNICVGNTDDHFRNHGFLLTSKGSKLSPAYDMNPTHNQYQSLLINATTNESSLDILLDSADCYLLEKAEAEIIIQEVRKGVSDWRRFAKHYGASNRDMDYFQSVLDRNRILDQQPTITRSKGRGR